MRIVHCHYLLLFYNHKSLNTLVNDRTSSAVVDLFNLPVGLFRELLLYCFDF